MLVHAYDWNNLKKGGRAKLFEMARKQGGESIDVVFADDDGEIVRVTHIDKYNVETGKKVRTESKSVNSLVGKFQKVPPRLMRKGKDERGFRFRRWALGRTTQRDVKKAKDLGAIHRKYTLRRKTRRHVKRDAK